MQKRRLKTGLREETSVPEETALQEMKNDLERDSPGRCWRGEWLTCLAEPGFLGLTPRPLSLGRVPCVWAASFKAPRNYLAVY